MLEIWTLMQLKLDARPWWTTQRHAWDVSYTSGQPVPLLEGVAQRPSQVRGQSNFVVPISVPHCWFLWRQPVHLLFFHRHILAGEQKSLNAESSCWQVVWQKSFLWTSCWPKSPCTKAKVEPWKLCQRLISICLHCLCWFTEWQVNPVFCHLLPVSFLLPKTTWLPRLGLETFATTSFIFARGVIFLHVLSVYLGQMHWVPRLMVVMMMIDKMLVSFSLCQGLPRKCA